MPTLSELYEKEHIIFDGKKNVYMQMDGLDVSRISTMKYGDSLKTFLGTRAVQKIEPYYTNNEDTLYNLVVSGSHTYCVDGYAVTGWPSEKDFNYSYWA
jgi:hypothetical protein